MIQKVEDICRRLCAYGMEYKYHEGYPHDWVSLLPAVQLAYNTSKDSTKGKSPSLVEKGWKPLFPVDHLKKNLLTVHPTAKDFHDMCKRAYETAAKCIPETEEYNKQRYNKTQKEPDFKEGDQVLVSTLNFNNLKGEKKMRDSFVGTFTIIKLIVKSAVDVIITEELPAKHPVVLVSLVKPYFHTGGDNFPSRKKSYTPKDMVEVEEYPGPVKRSSREERSDLMVETRDNIWSYSRTKQQIKINCWQKMPYQMVTFA
ncbi:hypothetical protein O181_000285 [Austropuccinia psidii MF-1]|uniref:Uncharacterized protein n=1 Tax=Austropuccinia psidii MF-1 TaxID=1389203 RepID=A0A9Q3GAQ6_9BASI|nr:hypothetical protein [Austropuccinia psidii MF-1]